MSSAFVLNSRWSGYLDGNQGAVQYFKGGVPAALKWIEENGYVLDVEKSASTVKAVLAEMKEPEGHATKFIVRLKTVSREFHTLSDAVAYQLRYGDSDTVIDEVAAD